MAYLIALDVGGTGIKAALLDATGRAMEQYWRPTGREQGPDAVVRRIVTFTEELQRQAAGAGMPASAVGLAVPGIVDAPAGVGIRSTTIGWRDIPFGELVRERTGLPVALSHDVRAGGVAEARLGAGRAHRWFLFVAVGTGIAAALVSDGRAVPGAQHRAGEIGHIPVRPGGEECVCGGAGCAEAYASAAAVARRHTALTGTHSEASQVARLAAAGDVAAGGVWDEAVTALADALLIACAVVDPPLIVLGGGLAESGELLLAPLRARMAERATVQHPPLLARAQLGDRAGCLGAGLLAADLTKGGIRR
ncbi:ROK family protein [Peterkaempfera griseoplana]|uniref:ROK family protein n=1 Tax=Peterkaempfera griseoplana TaxID=66896 RepID=UPI0006E3D672|nr:ROK family protein [Peterkaempfera griseoplana]